MESIRQRSVAMLPSVILTALSMIQAIAIELLWSRIRETPDLWTSNWDAVINWSQLATCFVGILLVWVIYLSLVMRFTWVPTVGDTVIPFLIGLLEFSLIASVGPSSLGVWFGIMGLIFVVMTGSTYLTFHRATRDPANRDVFESLPSPNWADLVLAVVPATTFFGLALFFSMTDSKGIVALMAILTAFGFICNRLWITRTWWNRTILNSH